MAFSAGVGRSGTFVAILWLMQLCARGILPDVHLAVRDLRRHRVLMVQTVVRAYPQIHLTNQHTCSLVIQPYNMLMLSGKTSIKCIEILCGKVM